MKRLLSAVVLVVFVAAIWILYHEIEQFHYHQILQAARAVPLKNLLLAFLFTVTSYLAMTGYDLLAAYYLGQPLPRRQIILASYISYAFSNTIGLSVLTAGSLRYRFYSLWGYSSEQITKLIIYVIATFWLGILACAGFVFTVNSGSLSGLSWLSPAAIRTLGIFFLLLLAAYLFFLLIRKAPLQLRGWEFSIPHPFTGVLQAALGLLDWCLAAAVLYVLLPEGVQVTFLQLLGIFMLSQIIALISHVPGGLGVFESMILLLTPGSSSPALLGSLLFFRLIYYLVPLAFAAVLLAYTELQQRRNAVSRMIQTIGNLGTAVTPKILAVTTLIAGTILLFSGATPTDGQRMAWLAELVPLPVVEFSHFFGSIIGALLLLLARGIDRRLDAAYVLTAIFLATGSLLTFVKGADYEEAVILLTMLLILLPCRRYFYRRASLSAETFTLKWTLTITVIFLSAVWIGLFSYKHVLYRQEMWWEFTFHGDASRFMRGAVGAGVLLLLFGVAKLLKPATHIPDKADKTMMENAASIVQQSPSTEANLALLGDKLLLFDQEHQGFVMYQVQGNSWISMGDPVAEPDVARDLAWQFRETVEKHGGKPVFYEVGPDMIHVYLDMGLSLYKLGEDARVPLESFSLEGSKRKGLRYTQRKLEKSGCSFEIIEPVNVPEYMDRLQHISEGWLKNKNGREKGFSLGYFTPDYLAHFPVAIVRYEGEIIAFANLWTGADKGELSVDLMRYLPEAPSGIMEFLFIHMLLWGKEQGYRFFNLGMAPLAGLENRPFAPLWHRIGSIVFRHGEHFYNFEGLRKYKEKFDPQWEPRYLACPGGLALPRILTDTATLIGGGFKGILGK